MRILAQGDRGLERELLRAKPEDPKHHDEVLLYEERLSRSQRRRILAHIVCCADLYPLRLVTSLNRHFKQASLWVVARTGSEQQQRGS